VTLRLKGLRCTPLPGIHTGVHPSAVDPESKEGGEEPHLLAPFLTQRERFVECVRGGEERNCVENPTRWSGRWRWVLFRSLAGFWRSNQPPTRSDVFGTPLRDVPRSRRRCQRLNAPQHVRDRTKRVSRAKRGYHTLMPRARRRPLGRFQPRRRKRREKPSSSWSRSSTSPCASSVT